MDIFTALAEPTRRSILEMLAKKGELSATEISDQFDSSSPAISQHLKILREAKLIRMEKRSRQRIYEMNPDAINQFEEWARHTRELWGKRFDLLENVLQAKNKLK